MPLADTNVATQAQHGLNRAEEIETPQIWEAWVKTLDLIEALAPTKIIPGHLEQGWDLDAKADLEHNKKYLDLFAEKIMRAPKKPSVDDIYQTFKNAFPKVGMCVYGSGGETVALTGIAG